MKAKINQPPIAIITKMFCICCLNLVIPASIGGELWRRQLKMGYFFTSHLCS